MIKLISPTHSLVYDGAVIKTFHANKGEGLPRHSHVYSHVTICHSGMCLVRKQDKELLMTKNTKPVNLKSNEWHEIEALEDNTVFCNIFAEGKHY